MTSGIVSGHNAGMFVLLFLAITSMLKFHHENKFLNSNYSKESFNGGTSTPNSYTNSSAVNLQNVLISKEAEDYFNKPAPNFFDTFLNNFFGNASSEDTINFDDDGDNNNKGGDDDDENTEGINHDDEGRSIHGYRLPRPPFKPIVHVPHTCSIPVYGGKFTKEVHLPTAVPHLILIGAQKSGTSTLQTIFDKQPNIIKPSFKRKFEPHFFDFDVGLRRPTVYNHTFSEEELCKFRKSYAAYFDLPTIKPNVSIVFEKTPSYMIHPSIPKQIDAICPWKPKILVTLRDPVSRAWSQFQMDNGNKRGANGKKLKPNPDLFYKQVDKEIEEFVKHGLLKGPFISTPDADIGENGGTLSFGQFRQQNSTFPFRFPNLSLKDYTERIISFGGNRRGDLFRGLYAPLLLPWVQQFARDDRLMVLRFEPFVKEEDEGNRTTVNEVLQFAGLVVDAAISNQGHHTSRQKSEPSNDLAEETDYDALEYSHDSNLTRRNLSSQNGQIRRHDAQRKRRRSRKLVWKLKREYDEMPPLVKEYLTLLYRPFNEFLPELLGEEWRDVWN